MATTIPQPSTTSAPPSTNPQPAKTPVTLHPTSHLDPSAYVRGDHPITISDNVLIHPRAHLISQYGAVSIDADAIVCTKSIIGGPIPTTSSPTSPARPTHIGKSAHIHANVLVNAGAHIGDYVVVEANAVIRAGVTVGKHSKVCAGVVVEWDVGDWIVVMGEGRERRRQGTGGGTAEVVENARVRVMSAEREATAAILRRAAAKSLVGHKAKR